MEAASGADVGKRAQMPVHSLEAASLASMLSKNPCPFLVQMGTDSLETDALRLLSIPATDKKSAIHEESYVAHFGMNTPLSEALQHIGTEIEYDIVVPPFSSLPNPEGFVGPEAEKLTRKQSRVFIVLQLSIPLATLFFREAKQIRLMDRDSVWILTDSISDLLDSVEPSFISSTECALGIRSYYSEINGPFQDVRNQFRKNFRLEYQNKENLDRGTPALKAYDSITAIAEAATRLRSNSTSTTNPNLLLNEILFNNFIGLSGKIRFPWWKNITEIYIQDC